jgi:hypothetical protein
VCVYEFIIVVIRARSHVPLIVCTDPTFDMQAIAWDVFDQRARKQWEAEKKARQQGTQVSQPPRAAKPKRKVAQPVQEITSVPPRKSKAAKPRKSLASKPTKRRR